MHTLSKVGFCSEVWGEMSWVGLGWGATLYTSLPCSQLHVIQCTVQGVLVKRLHFVSVRLSP